jgi:hypothetical protein
MASNVSGTFAAVGDSAPLAIEGMFTLAISGDFSRGGVVMLQRSHDQGATWIPVVLRGITGPTLYLSAPCVVSVVEPGPGMWFKLSCLAPATTGAISYRLGS